MPKNKLHNIKADIVLSVGSACQVALHMRKNFLRICASPIDWMMNDSLEVVFELFRTDFKNFFLNCSRVLPSQQPAQFTQAIEVKDDINGMVSIHHFFAHMDLGEQAKLINAQAIRRWQFIKDKLRTAKSVVFIYNGRADINAISDFLRKVQYLFNANIPMANREGGAL